jgi:hypothetical protein
MIFTRATIDALGFAQHAVDAVAHDGVPLAGLDVDIRGALLGRLEHQRVDPADDRRLVVGVEHVDELLGLELLFLGLAAGLLLLLELVRTAQPRVRLVDVIGDLRARRDDRLDRLGEDHGDRVDHVDRGRIRDRHEHAPRRLAPEREDQTLAREVDRQLLDQLDRNLLGARQVAQVRHLGLRGERERELILVDQLHAHEHLADQAAFFSLLRERALDRFGHDAASRDEDLAEQLRAEANGHRDDLRRWSELFHQGPFPSGFSIPVGAYSIGPGCTVWREPMPRRSSTSASTVWIARLISSTTPRLRR